MLGRVLFGPCCSRRVKLCKLRGCLGTAFLNYRANTLHVSSYLWIREMFGVRASLGLRDPKTLSMRMSLSRMVICM